MPQCLLCGHKGGDADGFLYAMGICHCTWCVSEADKLTPAAADALVELSQIPHAFSVWSQGRREDSGEHPAKQAKTPVPQPAEISPSVGGLFVGDLDDVADVRRLCELGIRSVLNLCPERLVNSYADIPVRLAEEGIRLLNWPAHDCSDFDIVDEVIQQGAIDFIDTALRSGGVLVNCWGGVNRSASVAVGYLVLRRRLPLVTTVREAMARRGTILTNHSFRRLLVQAALANGCPLQDETTELPGTGALASVAAVRDTPERDSKTGSGEFCCVAAEAATPPAADSTTSDWPCTDPKKRHRGNGAFSTPEYGFLYAASAPCISCARFYVEDMGLDPRSQSNDCDYSAIDFAEWELQRCRDASLATKYRTILEYLRAL